MAWIHKSDLCIIKIFKCHSNQRDAIPVIVGEQMVACTDMLRVDFVVNSSTRHALVYYLSITSELDD